MTMYYHIIFLLINILIPFCLFTYLLIIFLCIYHAGSSFSLINLVEQNFLFYFKETGM